jgi:hypothetical protein
MMPCFGQNGAVFQKTADQPVLIGAVGTQVIDDAHQVLLRFARPRAPSYATIRAFLDS